MIRIIICDDETASETIISYYIKSCGLPLEIIGTARDGQEAVSLIKKDRPDLVFMDIMMPYINGFDVIRETSSIISPKQFIIITGYESFEFAQTALRLGVSDIILKPLNISQINNAIMSALGRKVTGNPVVDKAIEYLHTHYNESVSLTALAEDLFCSPSHLSRSFTKEMGCSLTTYLREVRIHRAIELLDEETLTIAEIADKVGYPSLNGFYQAFKTITGKTPAQYSKSRQFSSEADHAEAK